MCSVRDEARAVRPPSLLVNASPRVIVVTLTYNERDGNTITNDTFRGTYPGINGSPAVPCIWLTQGTGGNRVQAIHQPEGPPAFDPCTHVHDDGAANDIFGYARCHHVDHSGMLVRARQHCVQHGGTWSDATQSCTFGADAGTP